MITNSFYYEGSGKDLNNVIASLLAGPATAIHQVICVKAGIFVILYS